MKIKIKTYNGELPTYLTAGKEYDFYGLSCMTAGDITSDDGDNDFIILQNCIHLNGGSWEVCDE